jgi:hypothetical protein
VQSKIAKGIVPYLHPYEKRQLIEAWARTQWAQAQLDFMLAVAGRIWKW